MPKLYNWALHNYVNVPYSTEHKSSIIDSHISLKGVTIQRIIGYLPLIVYFAVNICQCLVHIIPVDKIIEQIGYTIYDYWLGCMNHR